MKSEFVTQRMVQFAETDLAGVLHFANYYRMMEESEHAFWRSIGLSVITRDEEGEMSWPRVATSCEYSMPAYFEDVLDLVFRVTKVSERSFSFEVEFRRQGRTIARGHTTAACCRQKNGEFRAIAIPPAVREKLTSAQSAAAIA